MHTLTSVWRAAASTTHCYADTYVCRPLKDLNNYFVRATDNENGPIKDQYSDGGAWVIRYFVADTGCQL